MVKQLKKVHSLSRKIATAFSSSDLESRKIENKSALVNRKDPFSIKNLVQYGLYRSIRDKKFNGSEVDITADHPRALCRVSLLANIEYWGAFKTSNARVFVKIQKVVCIVVLD